MKEILVSGKLTKQDVVWFMFYHHLMKTSGIVTLGAGLVSLVAVPVMLYYDEMFFALILGLIAFMYGIFTPLDFYSRATRQLRMKPVFKNKMTFKFSEEGLRSQLYTGSMDIEWPHILMMTSNKNMFIVYMEEEQAFIIPKRYFACQDDISLVEDWIAHYRLAIPITKRVDEVEHDQ